MTINFKKVTKISKKMPKKLEKVDINVYNYKWISINFCILLNFIICNQNFIKEILFRQKIISVYEFEVSKKVTTKGILILKNIYCSIRYK